MNSRFVVVSLVVIFIAGLLVFFLWPMKNGCVRELEGVAYFLNAVKTNNENLCKKIWFENDKARCWAAILKNEEKCTMVPNSKKDPFCVAIAKNDVHLCAGDVMCEAVITKNSAVCDVIGTRDVDKGATKAEDELLKNDCRAFAALNADFFTSEKRLNEC